MKMLVPAESINEMKDFPYAVPDWQYGCDPNSRELLNSLLYTIDDPDTPDGMSYLMDIDGMHEWYDQVVNDEERKEHNCPTVYDYLSCEIGRYVTPVKNITMTPVVFINCTVEPYVDDIMCYLKQYETRNRNTLGRFLGERILIAETGHGTPLVKCSAIIDQIISVTTKEEWDEYLEQTWVPVGSKHDWQPDTKIKWLYSLTDIKPVEPFRLPKSCRRHGRVWAEFEGMVL